MFELCYSTLLMAVQHLIMLNKLLYINMSLHTSRSDMEHVNVAYLYYSCIFFVKNRRFM